MEFPELANACSYRGCPEKNDFLPFTCDGCGKKFCLDHHRHEQHQCHVPPRTDKYAPTCPLCMQAVTIMPNQDANSVIDQHIRAGCPSSQVKTRQNACRFPGCRAKEFVPISCKLCHQPFCLKHRFENDHSCPRIANKSQGASGNKPQMSAAAAAAQARAQQQGGAGGRGGGGGIASFQNTVNQHAARAQEGALAAANSARQALQQAATKAGGAVAPSASASSRAQPSARGGRQQQKHSNKPAGAHGATGIPERERMLVSAYFPVSTKRSPEFHVLNVSWSVGKAVDVLSQRGGVRNDNNLPGSQKLCLFSHDGSKLNNSSSLEDCVMQGKLSGGGVVILEYGDGLGASHDPKMFMDASKADKDCVVM